MNYDLILEQIGQFKRWQRLVFAAAGLFAACEALITYLFTFVGYEPEYRCYVPVCDMGDYDSYDFR